MSASRLAFVLTVFVVASVTVTSSGTAEPPADCHQNADNDAAIEACTVFLGAASDDQPSMVQAQFDRGRAYFSKHDYYHAIKDFSAVITASPHADPILYAVRGTAYYGEIDDEPDFVDLAIADVRFALDNKPDLDGQFNPTLSQELSSAYLIRAATNLANGREDLALEDEKSAIHLTPDAAMAIRAKFAQAYIARARKSLADANFDPHDGAAADFRTAIELDPTQSDSLAPEIREAESGQPGPYSALARGSQSLGDGNYDSAVDDFTEAIRINPKLVEAYLDREKVYETLGRLDDARADLDQAIKLDPNNWQAYFQSGNLYDTMEQFDQASASYEQASNLIDQLNDAGTASEKARIEDALKKLQFDRTLNDHWVSYLKQVQLSNDYPNWSAPPYDLYMERHSLPKLSQSPAAAPVAAPAAPERRTTTSPFGKLVMPLLIALSAFLALGWLIRRRRTRAHT